MKKLTYGFIKEVIFLSVFLTISTYGQHICEFLPSNEVRIYTDFNESNDLIDYINSQRGKVTKDAITSIYLKYRNIAFDTDHLHHCDTSSKLLNKALQKDTKIKSNLVFYHPNGEVDHTQIYHAVVIVKYNKKTFIIDITHDQFFCSNEGILIAEEKNYTQRINELGYARRSELIKRAPRSDQSKIKY